MCCTVVSARVCIAFVSHVLHDGLTIVCGDYIKRAISPSPVCQCEFDAAVLTVSHVFQCCFHFRHFGVLIFKHVSRSFCKFSKCYVGWSLVEGMLDME